MIDFNKLIDNHLERASKPKTIGRYYPSEVGSCIRRVWYSYKCHKETEADLLRIFEAGNIMHEFVVDVIQSEKNSDVELLKSEFPFKLEIDDFVVSGRIDDLMLVKLSGKTYVVEVKSVSHLSYKNEPSNNHLMQLQLYMHALGIHNGMVLYIEKNTLNSRTFHVGYSEKIVERAMKKFRLLHNLLTANKLPEPEAKQDEEIKWMCGNCNYKGECDENVEALI